ncbi:MAG: AbrB/MazE/SpoVT family DNA-binding domain-containing protein [Oscillospiraceae bacterium]
MKMYTLHMDPKGKILIPAAVREELGLKESMLLNLDVRGNSIGIYITTPRYQLCGDVLNVQFTPMGALCESCIYDVYQYYTEEQEE